MMLQLEGSTVHLTYGIQWVLWVLRASGLYVMQAATRQYVAALSE